MFTHCSFDTTKNKLDYYRAKDCMKKCCKDLRTSKENNRLQQKEMIPLTDEEKNHTINKKFAVHVKKN